MTTAIYARLSTADEADSISGQVDLCRKWLVTQPFWDSTADVAVYSEDAQSAYSKDMAQRPEWSRLERDIRSGLVTRVVARHMDRLTRSVADLLALVELVKETGVQIDTVWSGALNLNTDAGRTIATIMAAITASESGAKSERVRATKARRRADGRASGGPTPFGWTGANGDIVPEEAEILRKATAHILNKGSLLGATRIFTESGILPKNGEKWQPTNVRYILTRWRNAGRITHKGEDAGPATGYEGIVSLEDLKKVRAIFDNADRSPFAARRVGRGRYAQTLLSGIATCAKCGVSLKGGGKNKSGTDTYQCLGCMSQVSRPLLDELAATAMVRFWTRVNLADVAPTKEIEAEIRRLSAALDEIEEERQALVAMRTDGTLRITEFQTLMQEHSERGKSLDAQLQRLQDQFAVAGVLRAPDSPLEVGTNLLARWHAQPLDIQRRQLAEVWDISIRPWDESKAQTFEVNGKQYRESVSRARMAQRRALFTCRLADALSFDPVAEDLADAQSAVIEALQDPDRG